MEVRAGLGKMAAGGITQFHRLTVRRTGRSKDGLKRVISGIIGVLKSGGRWIDVSNIYRSRKSLYDWFVRWTEKGVWTDVFDTLSQIGGPALKVMIDSTAVQHRVAHGGNRGSDPRHGPSSLVSGKQNPRFERQLETANRLLPHKR